MILQGRSHDLTLVSIHEHAAGRTLLGTDFLKAANIILDMPNEAWYYADTPYIKYPFITGQEITPYICLAESGTVKSDINLRSDKETCLSEQLRTQVIHLLV